MKSARFVPFWAWQFAVGIVVVLVAVAMFATLVGAAMRVPSNFLDEVGRTVSRVVPQEAADIPSDADLRKVIAAMPHGKLRVATIDTEHDRVVFTITADRAAVKAAIQTGDELRIARDGSVEVAPTGIPGVIDALQRAMEELRRRIFGQ